MRPTVCATNCPCDQLSCEQVPARNCPATNCPATDCPRPNSSLPFIQDFICIVRALLNFFHVPMINPSPYDDETIRHMNSLRKESNDLQPYLNNNDLT